MDLGISSGDLVLLTYLLGSLESLEKFFVFFTVLSVVALFACCILYTELHQSIRESVGGKWALLRIYLSMLSIVFFSTLVAVVPSKETGIQMLAVYGASEVIQSETAKDITNSLTELTSKTKMVIEKKLDEELAK